MNPGDPVEVNAIWASQGATAPPLRAWFSGYELVANDGREARVRATKGLFEGLETRWPSSAIRPARSRR